MGLVEAIMAIHGNNGPNTHNRGKNPIDRIFTPWTLAQSLTSGYYAFGEGIPSNHRALWIDIPLATLGWFTVPSSIPLKAWRLQCKDPRIIEYYNKELHKLLAQHRLVKRLQVLSNQTQNWRITRTQQREYEEIDALTTQAKILAEAQCRKLPVGKVPWCPQLSKVIAQIWYWKGIRKRLLNSQIGAQLLHHLACKGGMQHQLEHLQLNTNKVNANIQKAYKCYTKLKNDKNRWDTWLASLVEAQATARQVSKKSLWNRIRSTERIRNNARMIKKVLAIPDQWQGLAHVIGPNFEDPSKQIKSSLKAELKKLCLEEAGHCFTQASTTPFLQPPLLNFFSEANVFTKAFKQVLAGTFICPPDTDPMAQRLIQAMRRPRNLPLIAPRRWDEVTSGWSKARKATSSAPSAVHFGHYMAGTFSPMIAVFNAQLTNLGFTTGYSLKWWRTGLNVMLEKQVGNMNVEKLWIILLFKGDFNQNNKWLGQAVMFNAEQYLQMALEQYGSQKEKLAGIQCLNKRLLYDYTRSTHRPLALCSNNAKSCYDCIVLIVAALCLCHLEAPKPKVQSMITTLHKMQHHIRSTYGDSTQSQGQQQWAAPIAGIGQGNGAGPQIWAAVSSLLFQILTADGFIAQIICAISGHRYSLSGFGFVDNVDLCITVPNNDRMMVVEKLQNSLRTLVGLLRATGGALVPDKCFCTMCTTSGKMEPGSMHGHWHRIKCKCRTTKATSSQYPNSDRLRPNVHLEFN